MGRKKSTRGKYSNKTVEIYTDGSLCLSSHISASAWLIFFRSDNEEYYESDYELHNSNVNRAELSAVINSLEHLRYLCNNSFKYSKIKIHTDSNFVVRNIQKVKRYGNLPRLERDLWEKMDPICFSERVSVVKVKAHSNVHFNNVVDKKAKMALCEAKEMKAREEQSERL